jgi:hypothetical protein
VLDDTAWEMGGQRGISRIRKARKLRAGGIPLSTLVRDAIDQQYDRLVASAKPRDVEAIMRQIYARFPDPPDLLPREYDVHNRVAAREAMLRKVSGKRKYSRRHVCPRRALRSTGRSERDRSETPQGIALLLAATLRQDAAVQSETRLREVIATVTDESGQYVRGLTGNSFILEEQGKPQAIARFEPRSEAPVSVGLLIDASVSMHE